MHSLCPCLVLEGHCPVEFSSNPNYGVCRVKLELSSAGRWPSRSSFGHPWTVSELDSSSLQAELEHSLEESRQSARAAQESLSEKETELKELRSQKASEQGLVSKEDHEAQRLSLQAEINTLMTQLANLARKHEKTCTEVCVVLDFVYDSFLSTYLHRC